MENAPVINMTFVSLAPGVEKEIVQRYHNWTNEATIPLIYKNTSIMGINRYNIIRKNPEYSSWGTIQNWENIGDYEKYLKSQEKKAVNDDLDSWVRRGVRQGVWSVVYELIKSFRADTATNSKRDTRIENASLMHLEAYRMTPEDQERFNKWFEENSRVFIPLFMKTCGLKGYDYLKYSDFSKSTQASQARETEYPSYLSILYFEDLKAFESFQESPEQDSFQSVTFFLSV
jgi:hypothetical protein